MPRAFGPGALGGVRRRERDVEILRAVGRARVPQTTLDVGPELVVEAITAALLADDEGRMPGGDLGRESGPRLAQRRRQQSGVGALCHGQNLEEPPRRRGAAREDPVEDRRVRAPRVRDVHRGARDAPTEDARELAQEDRMPVGEGPEALRVEPEEPGRRQRDHRGGARVARDQRHLAEAVALAQDGDPLALSVAHPADLDGPAHDHVERVAGVALREHGAAGGDLDLVELADEAREDLAREVLEQRYGPERRDDRVHRQSRGRYARRPESVRQDASPPPRGLGTGARLAYPRSRGAL